MKHVKFTRRHRNLLLCGVAVAAAVAVFYILAKLGIGIPCLFNRITGLLCPGCGNSRAALALMRLDIGAAFGYNLMFPVEFLYIAWVVFWCCRAYLQGKPFAYKPPCLWLDGTVLAVVLLWWLIRNIM